MKQILIIISLSLLMGCNAKKENQESENFDLNDTITKENKQDVAIATESKNAKIDSFADRNLLLKNEFKSFQVFDLKDTIKADFNGDKIIDFAYFSIRNDKKEMFVIDGKTKNNIKIGLDKSFGDMADDFSWVDFWGTTEDKETFEVIIKDEEVIGDTIAKLMNKSIFVRKEEVGGGVVTYKDNKFIWVHQSD